MMTSTRSLSLITTQLQLQPLKHLLSVATYQTGKARDKGGCCHGLQWFYSNIEPINTSVMARSPLLDGRRRPMSTFESHSSRHSPLPLLPAQQTLSPVPLPTDILSKTSAPPPPPRTLSKNADPVQKWVCMVKCIVCEHICCVVV